MPPNPVSTRRDRRIDRQRRQIMDAAARIFAEKGFSAATTKEIAEAADIGESTIYNYFGGKRDLFLAVASLQSEALDAVFQNSRRMESREQMAQAFVQVMDILLSNSHYTRALLAEAWVNDEILFGFLAKRLVLITQFLQEFIQQRVASGAFHPIDTRLAARMAISTFIGFILPALRGIEALPSPEERQRLARTVIDLWMDGVEVKGLP